jgi:hypothetical protein
LNPYSLKPDPRKQPTRFRLPLDPSKSRERKKDSEELRVMKDRLRKKLRGKKPIKEEQEE